ncbi:hypothetical protein QBC38DRAFT_486015 [Podospora fimiseda]|uniref:Uncharacterized protein n=1 Tax=Podospora fimiseda TaxID=252190 RepID=A0AAN7GZJ5_9PEZI|nr:hypothetical protein QBC38DRAFT_486015 [Podospora fimiseda]
MSQQLPPPPPLLLSKPLTSFLRANLSPPQIQTLMLTTPRGNLLAHASSSPLPSSPLPTPSASSPLPTSSESPYPASATSTDTSAASLRRQCAIAASLSPKPTVTILLDNGSVFTVRKLSCGMLFVCMGQSSQQPQQSPQQQSTAAAVEEEVLSENASVCTSTTTATTTTTYPLEIKRMRRTVEELGKWLDDKLGGLNVPEEGIVGGGNRPGTATATTNGNNGVEVR